jgi:WD40 repeat protein
MEKCQRTLIAFTILLSTVFTANVRGQNPEPLIAKLLGHKDAIESLAFSANGDFLLSGGDDTTVRFWNLAKRQEVHVFTGHTAWINAVALSPDGKLAASSSAKEKSVRLWDTEKGKLIKTLTKEDAVNSLAFSPDGRVLAAGGYNHLRFFDIQTGEVRKKVWLYEYQGLQATVVAFSPDGSTIMSTIVDLPGNIPGRFREWDVKTDKLKKDVALGFSYWPENPQAAISNDGRLVAFWEKLNQQVIVWDVNNQKEKWKFPGFSDRAWSFAFSPGGGTLAIGSWDGSIKLLDMRSGAEVGKLNLGKELCAFALAFSPDGKVLAAGMEDSSIRIWKVGAIRAEK